MKALKQAERRAQTRDRLLSAASRVFAQHGYHAATVDAIAAEAGYSTGALYAHFEHKEDLFLELVAEHVDRQVERYKNVVSAGDTLEERSRAGADAWMAYLHEEPDYFPLFIAFWSYAAANEKLRPELADRFAGLQEAGTALIKEGAEKFQVPLVEGFPERIALIVTALGNGLALHKLAAPDAVPDELFGDTLSLFFAAIAALAREYQQTNDTNGDGKPTAPP
jgi:AcrR family transcriptional regulator